MDLSKRLMSIIKLISYVKTLSDIGTDHGYIPIYAVSHSLCEKSIASDINNGPLNKARTNIRLAGLDDNIELRLGPGLTVIKEYEVQAAVISGMGGDLTRDIIEHDINLFKAMEYIIVQPAQNIDVFRKYVFEKGFNILDENICLEDNKYYETMKISYGNNPIGVDNIFYEISESLYKKNDITLKQYISFLVNKYIGICDRLNDNTKNSTNRKFELQCKIDKLNFLLKNMGKQK